MDKYIARQPIFNSQENVYAYELLFRSSADATAYTATDPDAATFSVLSDAFLLFGIDKLTGGKPAFINFTRKGLQQMLTTYSPEQSVVIEILEDIEPDREILDICRQLKQRGYVIALDDFVFADQYRELIELADIIKIDFLATPVQERQMIIRRLNHSGIKFLAEKVETRADFEQAVASGYSYFQGYFFSKPETFTAKKLVSFDTQYFQLLHEVRKTDIDFARLEELIKRDVSLFYKLLKYINSVYFGLKRPISSIRQALVLLGQHQIECWLTLLILRDIVAEDKSDRTNELMNTSNIRAKFGELLAQKMNRPELAAQAFMTGMFSLLDCLLNRSLTSILQELSIHNDIKQALQGADTHLGNMLALIIAYEQYNWQAVSHYAQICSVPAKWLPALYLEALEWSVRYCRQIDEQPEQHKQFDFK